MDHISVTEYLRCLLADSVVARWVYYRGDVSWGVDVER